MAIASIAFLFYFLPAALLLYLAAPRPLRPAILCLATLVFLFWGSGPLALLLPAYVLLTYGLGLAAERFRGHRCRRIFPALSVCSSLLMLAVFPYGAFLIGSVNAVLGSSFTVPTWRAPVGILVYTLQGMSYVLDVSRGEAKAQRNPLKLAAWMAFFPRLLFGPVGRYRDAAPEMSFARPGWADLSDGAFRLAVGLAKKEILGGRLLALAAFAASSGEQSLLLSWLGAVAFTMGVTFSCAGVCDMAIGLGRLFGVSLPENFRDPFAAGSISEFCARWNRSLGDWCRTYVLGTDCKGRWIRLLLAACLMGLWHGAGWNYALWGLWFGMLLFLEQGIASRLKKKIPAVLRHIWVIAAVPLGFAFLQTSDLGGALSYLGALLGLRQLPLWSGDTGYVLSSYWLVLLLGALAVTPLPRRAAARLRECPRMGPILAVVKPLALAVLLLASTGYLAVNTARPSLIFPF